MLQTATQDRGERVSETGQTQGDKTVCQINLVTDQIIDYGNAVDISGHSSLPGCLSGGKTLHN